MDKKTIASFALGPIASAVFGSISLPVITWFYSAEDIGRIAMLQVVTSICILLFGLGLDQSYVREYHESSNKTLLLKTALAPGLLLLIVTVAGLLLWPNALSNALFKVNNFLISVLIAVCLLATFISRFLSLILRMQEKGLAFSMSQFLPKLLFLMVVGVYVLFSFGFDLLHLLIAQTSSIVMVTAVYSWNTRKHWLEAIGQSIDIQDLKRMLSFGAPLILGGLASWSLMAMSRLFLRNFSTFDQLGIYSVATNFAAAAILVQSIFSTVWAPTVYKWAASGINSDKINKVSEQVLALVVILFALSGMCSWLVSFLLPAKYVSVQYQLVSCMANPLFYTLSEITGIGLGITRRSMLAMTAAVSATLVNLVGCYYLVPRYGSVGASISTAVTYWVFFFFRTELAIRAWQPLPRAKLYIFTTFCLMMSVLFTFFGEKLHTLFIGMWCLLLIVAVVYFKSTVQVIISYIYKREAKDTQDLTTSLI